jgi:hypothetical protein
MTSKIRRAWARARQPFREAFRLGPHVFYVAGSAYATLLLWLSRYSWESEKMAAAERIGACFAQGEYCGEFNAGEQVAHKTRYVFNTRLEYFGGDEGYLTFIVVACIFAPFALRKTLLRRRERNALLWYHGLLLFYLATLSTGHELFIIRLRNIAGYNPAPEEFLTVHGMKVKFSFELRGCSHFDITAYDPSRICLLIAAVFLALLLVRGRPVL